MPGREREREREGEEGVGGEREVVPHRISQQSGVELLELAMIMVSGGAVAGQHEHPTARLGFLGLHFRLWEFNQGFKGP